MTIPQWSLLGFALWTLTVLTATVGVYRWSRILTRRSAINDFRGDQPAGADWYLRGVRAHANCVENLPVFAVVVAAISWLHAEGGLLDALAVSVIIARLIQSSVHMAFRETQRTVSIRFSFYMLQVVCMVAMAALAIAAHGATGLVM